MRCTGLPVKDQLCLTLHIPTMKESSVPILHFFALFCACFLLAYRLVQNGAVLFGNRGGSVVYVVRHDRRTWQRHFQNGGMAWISKIVKRVLRPNVTQTATIYGTATVKGYIILMSSPVTMFVVVRKFLNLPSSGCNYANVKDTWKYLSKISQSRWRRPKTEIK